MLASTEVERLRDGAHAAVREHHSRLIAVHVERKDMGAMLSAKDSCDVMAKLAKCLASVNAIHASRMGGFQFELECTPTMVYLDLDRDDDVRIRAPSDIVFPQLFEC